MTPTFDTVVPDLTWLWLVVAGVIPLGAAFLIFLVLASEAKTRKELFGVSAAVSFVCALACVIGPIIYSVNVSDDATVKHAAQVRAWVAEEYGARADKATFGEALFSGEPFAAVVGGRPQMIKLAKGPDGQILVFGPNNEPLPKRG